MNTYILQSNFELLPYIDPKNIIMEILDIF